MTQDILVSCTSTPSNPLCSMSGRNKKANWQTWSSDPPFRVLLSSNYYFLAYGYGELSAAEMCSAGFWWLLESGTEIWGWCCWKARLEQPAEDPKLAPWLLKSDHTCLYQLRSTFPLTRGMDRGTCAQPGSCFWTALPISQPLPLHLTLPASWSSESVAPLARLQLC